MAMSVLVTDAAGNHALAVARSLGQRGIRVALADSARTAKGLFSRHCADRAWYPSPAHGVRPFHDALFGIVDRLKPTVLMPMTERTILALLADRAAIESRVPVVTLPSTQSLRLVFDKSQTVRLATSLEVPVPKTFVVTDVRDLPRLREQMSFPVVIKPRTSEVWTVDDRIVSSGAVEYCFDPRDLEATLASVHRRAPFPLIQEFIPGDGYGVSVLCRRGRIKALFAHRRLRMVKPTGSGSSLRESVEPPPRMVDAATRLLEALAWNGVAMVEFKLDQRDGTPKLMEINGRFWNSLPLATAAGVDFPFLLYTMATEGDAPDCFDYRVGVKSRWLVADARHLIGVMRGRPAGWVGDFPSRRQTLAGFVKFVDRDLYYDELSLSDPKPFLAELVDVMVRQLPQSIFRRRPAPVEERSTRCVFSG
jgi:predicted ATP-grasp superfamily ATP-dependent carboligase